MWTANIEKQLVICYYSVRFMFIFNLCLFCFYIVLYSKITIITNKNTVHRIFIYCKSKRQMLNKLDSKRSNSKMKKKVMKSIWLIISIRINNQVAIMTNQKNNCKQAHKNIVCMRVKKQSGQHTDTHTPTHTPGSSLVQGFMPNCSFKKLKNFPFVCSVISRICLCPIIKDLSSLLQHSHMQVGEKSASVFLEA